MPKKKHQFTYSISLFLPDILDEVKLLEMLELAFSGDADDTRRAALLEKAGSSDD